MIHAWHSDLLAAAARAAFDLAANGGEHEANLNPKIPHQHQDGPDPVIQSSFWQRMINTPAIPVRFSLGMALLIRA